MSGSAIDNSTRVVSLDLCIETPENIVLTYEIAGPAIRCAAYLVDFFARAMVVSIVSVGLICAGAAIGLGGMSMGLVLLLLFFFEWGYFVACELGFNGRSIGKKMFGLRVIEMRGHPVTFWSSMQRNLVRAADSLMFYGPGLTCMICSRQCRRIGDLVAGTVVIQERRVVLPREPLILEKIPPLDAADINRFVPPTRILTLIDQFLGRRFVLTHQRGHQIASRLARALAWRLEYSGDPEVVQRYPMAFLARVYVTFLKTDGDETGSEVRSTGPERISRSGAITTDRVAASSDRPFIYDAVPSPAAESATVILDEPPFAATVDDEPWDVEWEDTADE